MAPENGGGGFDPIKAVIVLILAAAMVTGGLAYRQWREYQRWDRALFTDIQDWRGFDPKFDINKRQNRNASVRVEIADLAARVQNMPPGRRGGASAYTGIGTFLTQVANERNISLTKYEERSDVRDGMEEARFAFEVRDVPRLTLLEFFYQIETERPVLRVLEIANLKPNDKVDDYDHWTGKVTVAYRRGRAE